MALNSAKTWVGISSYNSWFVFSAQNTIGDWDFHREAFIVRLSLTAHFMIFKSSCIGFTSGKNQYIQRQTLLCQSCVLCI